MFPEKAGSSGIGQHCREGDTGKKHPIGGRFDASPTKLSGEPMCNFPPALPPPFRTAPAPFMCTRYFLCVLYAVTHCANRISKSAVFSQNRAVFNGGAIVSPYDATFELPDDTVFEGNTIHYVGFWVLPVFVVSGSFTVVSIPPECRTGDCWYSLVEVLLLVLVYRAGSNAEEILYVLYGLTVGKTVVARRPPHSGRRGKNWTIRIPVYTGGYICTSPCYI